MEQFVLTPYSIYQLQRKQKLEQKQEKQESVPKKFNTIYSAVKARLEMSNIWHFIDSIFCSPRIKLSQSDNKNLDTRDTKESFVDFVWALEQKNSNFPDIY